MFNNGGILAGGLGWLRMTSHSVNTYTLSLILLQLIKKTLPHLARATWAPRRQSIMWLIFLLFSGNCSGLGGSFFNTGCVVGVRLGLGV